MMASSARRVILLGVTLFITFCVVSPPAAEGDGVYSAGLFQLGDGQPPPGFAGAADILRTSGQAGPDWEDLFTAEGRLRDDYPLGADGQPAGNGVPDFVELNGGRWAVFTADDVSLGSGFESTARAGSPDLVRNGTAASVHDIGNAYVYSTVDETGHTVLFLGAERFSDGDSYLEFELNQALVRLGHGGFGSGKPWQVLGARAANDVLVRLDFALGTLASVTVYRQSGGEWQVLAAVAGEGCDEAESLCALANASAIAAGPWGNQEIAPGRFAEVGVNLGALLGAEPALTSIRIRTPGDIAFGYFGEGN